MSATQTAEQGGMLAMDVRALPSCMSLDLLYTELKMLWQRESRWPTEVVMTFEQAVDYGSLIAYSYRTGRPLLRDLTFEGARVRIED